MRRPEDWLRLEIRYRPRVVGMPGHAGGSGVRGLENAETEADAHADATSDVTADADGWAGWVAHEMARHAGCAPSPTGIMAPKADAWAVRLEGLTRPLAHIIKECCLAAGGDCAIHPDGIHETIDEVPAVVVVTGNRLEALERALTRHGDDVAALGGLLRDVVHRVAGTGAHARRVLRLPGGRDLDVSPGARPLVMGILNVTPDSFSDGGQFDRRDAALAHAERMIADGADIIDVGGESTRPGAEPVPDDEQSRRVVPVIEALRERFPDTPISIDSAHPTVIEAALEAGAHIVNDVTAAARPPYDEEAAQRATGDAASGQGPSVPSLLAPRAQAAVKHGAPYIAMHMQGAPRTMQRAPRYRDVTGEVAAALMDATMELVEAGLARDQVVIDPGFGFGKRLAHNVELLARLAEFRSFGQPVLVGISRKSSLGRLSADDRGESEPPAVDDRLPESLAAAVIAVLRGASLLRVHDVRETRKALAIAHATR